jgi:hypothetical protein
MVDHVLLGRQQAGAVDDVPVPHAECYRLDADAVVDSVAVVEQWAMGLTP